MKDECKKNITNIGSMQDPQRIVGESEGILFDSYERFGKQFFLNPLF